MAALLVSLSKLPTGVLLIADLDPVLVAFAFLLLLPRKPSYTRPLIGFKMLDIFTDRDRDIMTRRITLEDRLRSKDLTTISFKDAARALYGNYFIWLHAAISILSLVPKGGLLLYAPTIIKNLGFSTITANLLAAVSNMGLIVLSLIAAKISDLLQMRGPVCLACTVYVLCFAGAQYSLVLSTDKWTKYAIFTLFM